MNVRRHVLPAAGIALLLGASFAFAQQGSTPAAQSQSQQTPNQGASAYYCPYAGSGMYQGTGNGANMGAMWQRSGMNATFQNLQATLEKAKGASDPAEVKSLLNQAQQQLSQLSSHMRGWFMGNGNGMMMNGGMMHGGMMNGHMYGMGQQPGYMMGNPPASNNPQN